MVTFYSILMSLNALCAVTILLSGVDRKRPHFITLAVLNVVLFTFHFLSLSLHLASDINEAITISKLHLACIIIGHPLLVLVFVLWTRFKYTNTVFYSFFVFSLPLLLINFLSDFSIRYGEHVELISYTSVFGDSVSILMGNSSAYFPLIHFSYAIASIFVCYCVIRFYNQHQRYLFTILLVTIVLQVLASFIGYEIDRGHSQWVYVGGVPSTVLSLMVLGMISRGFKEKSDKLISESVQKEALHDIFSRLAKISNEDGLHSFYEESIELLVEYSKADYVIYGIVEQNNPHNIATKVVFKDGKKIDNFVYERKGTPCENVLSIDACVHREDVWLDYPDDVMLKEEGIEAYIGHPIVGSQRCAVGVLVLLYKTPLKNEKIIKTVTDVFATRISAEYRRDTLQSELKATAYVDYVTRLPNRTKLLTYINNIRLELIKKDSQALLMLFDLDHFGEVNRKYGYDVGDTVIKIIGERLSSYTSESVFISRSGGDEFAVVIPKVNADITNLTNVHWTAIQAIVNQTCNVGNRKININCTMGAVVFPSQLQANLDVLGAAEQALLQAKDHGRGRYTFFEPSFLSDIEYARELESDLVAALYQDDGLDVFYQPKVDREGNIIGAEALLRWFSNKRGFVSPVEFIPIAEETGVIHLLGQWVLARVLSDISSWIEKGYNLVPIAINATASQFEDSEFIEHLITSVKNKGIPSQLLELELTESGLFTDKNKAIETLSRLRKFGIKVALDDFGTGYSSLSYLSELPLDVLKIDKAFVDGLNDDRNRELVKSIIAISKAMGLTNVAEGTECQDQVELLESYGCRFFQGYFFSKPLIKSEFEEWLKL